MGGSEVGKLGSEVLALLEGVPATFWGVLAGSFFTLLGVWFTNRATERRMRMQFAHERQLREQDRQLALRKEIFFDLVQALTECSTIVAKTTNIQNSAQDLISEFNAKLVSISRSRLVLPITALPKAEMTFETIQNAVNKALLRRALIIEANSRLIEEADSFRRHPNLFGLNHAEIQRQRGEDVKADYEAFREEVAQYQKDVNTAGAALLLALRIELGIATDPDVWVALLSERDMRRQNNEDEIVKLQAGSSGSMPQP